MANKNLLIAGAAVVVVAAGAYFFMAGGSSSCTAEEYTKKAQAVQSDIIALQQKNPQAFQDAMMKMQNVAQEMSKDPTNFGPACKALDEIAAIAKQ